jgi:hypothetical protein
LVRRLDGTTGPVNAWTSSSSGHTRSISSTSRSIPIVLRSGRSAGGAHADRCRSLCEATARGA